MEHLCGIATICGGSCTDHIRTVQGWLIVTLSTSNLANIMCKPLQVRKAFTADVAAGNTLVVADYGQLELRLLAHMTNCTSMLQAFQLGGDFHSRTALGMYDHIQEAIKQGEQLLPIPRH